MQQLAKQEVPEGVWRQQELSANHKAQGARHMVRNEQQTSLYLEPCAKVRVNSAQQLRLCHPEPFG
jgi:hypothetical protein